MKRTISFTTGKGSVNHNSRKFHATNIDPERSHLNIEYFNENIKYVYHELFDEALARYNEKQTRNDRRIDDYYYSVLLKTIYFFVPFFGKLCNNILNNNCFKLEEILCVVFKLLLLLCLIKQKQY